tara:strand:- start:1268 stop:2038 length:771 start_codon:yes stop_codon:yes gene_type:complete
MEELENIEPTESDLNIEKSRSDLLAWDAMESATQDKTSVALQGEPDRISSDDVHNMLMAAGMTPVIGAPADLADAVLYAMEGEFGSAALAGVSAIPGTQLLSTAKWWQKAADKAKEILEYQGFLKKAKDSGETLIPIYKGVSDIAPGQTIKEGMVHGTKAGRVPSEFTTTNLDKAKWQAAGGTDAANKTGAALFEGSVGESRKVIEFEVPLSWINREANVVNARTGERINDFMYENIDEMLFEEGIPSAFIKKIHK